MKEKVVLAYSGGLDTTALIPWQIATAPSLRAISTSFLAMTGRAMDVPRR